MAELIDVPDGLAGVVAAETEISDVVGDHGYYHYRGHSAAELARTTTFESAANLILTGSTDPLILDRRLPDGLAELIGRVRTDYKILTRSLLTGIPEIEQFMIPVPFPHEENAIQKSLEMRKATMAHLAAGGVVVLFPSGVVASSDTWWGPAIEREWNPFTAKMVVKSGASVVPIRFPGANSRAYQIADKVSATLRQGLLLHEVVHALNRKQRPHVGLPFDPEEIAKRRTAPRVLMEWMRAETLALGAGI